MTSCPALSLAEMGWGRRGAMVWLAVLTALVGGVSTDALGSGKTGVDEMLCGPYCLWLVLRFEGQRESLFELTSALCPQGVGHGTTLGDIQRIARSYGFDATAWQTCLRDLDRFPGRRTLLLVDGRTHLVLLLRNAADGVEIVDSLQRRHLSSSELEVRWDGTAILFERNSSAPGPDRGGRETIMHRGSPVLTGIGAAIVAVGCGLWSAARGRRTARRGPCGRAPPARDLGPPPATP